MNVEKKDLKAILDINRKINSLKDVKSILHDISHYAGDLLNAEGASILLMDQATGDLHFEVAFGENAEALYDLVVPKGKGIAGTVADTQKHIIVNDTRNDDRFYKGIDEKTELITKNLVAVPLIHNEQTIGVLEVINAGNIEGFTDENVATLNQFAEQAALAIYNAQLYRQIQDKANELEYLYQISNLTNNTLEKKKLFVEITHLLSNAFASNRISIMFINEDSGRLYIEAAVGIEIQVTEHVHNSIKENRISSIVASRGKPLYGNNIEKAGFGRNKKLRYQSSAFMSVPIKIKNIPIGVINVSEPHENTRYNSSMIKTLQTIANQVGSAYESNRNYMEHVEHEKIKKELDIMRMLQQALLISNFKDYQHISIYATMIPAKIVGGDFYDIFELDDNRLAFVIGDVSGKGLPASLFMAISRSVVKAYAYYIDEPHQLLEYTNNIMVEDSRVGMFVTIFFGILDMRTGLVRYTNGGHNQQYVYRPGTDEFISLTTPGIPVGIAKSQEYETNEIIIDPGDILFCYTDGISEAVNQAGEEYGLDRIKQIIREYYSTNSKTLVKSVVREVNEWAEGVPQWDDMTVLAFKRI